MSDQSETRPIPLNELLAAIELIVEDRGEGVFEEMMPTMFAFWRANRERAYALFEWNRL